MSTYTPTPEEIFRSHYKKIFGYYLAKQLTREDAEDLCQETFVKIVKHYPDLQNPNAVYKWVWLIARNVLNTHLRDNGRVKRDAPTVGLDFVDPPAYVPDHAYDLDHKAAVRLMRQCIRKLPEQMHRIIQLKDLAEQRLAQISEVLNLHIGTVKSSRHRALGNLKQCIEDFLRQTQETPS